MTRQNNGNEPLGNIWDVVSGLAQALTSARDQLVGLITFPGTALMRGGSPNAVCAVSGRGQGKGNTYRAPSPAKAYTYHARSPGKENAYRGNENVPRQLERAHYQGGQGGGCQAGSGGGGGNYTGPTGKKPSNRHRQHARGHVAFGNHSEFKPRPPGRRGRSPGRGGKKGAQSRLFLNPTSNSSPCKPKRDTPRCDKDANCRLRPPSPNSKRHCVGTLFAVTLKEEACRARAQRLAEEKEARGKPKWTRF